MPHDPGRTITWEIQDRRRLENKADILTCQPNQIITDITPQAGSLDEHAPFQHVIKVTECRCPGAFCQAAIFPCVYATFEPIDSFSIDARDHLFLPFVYSLQIVVNYEANIPANCLILIYVNLRPAIPANSGQIDGVRVKTHDIYDNTVRSDGFLL